MSTNLAGIALSHAKHRPDRLALVLPLSWDDNRVTEEATLTYAELADRVARIRSGLRDAGLKAGDRVVVMFGVSPDLYALVLALLASQMVVVFVDTGMGKARVLEALKMSRARAIVSVDALLKYWPWVSALRGVKRYSVDRRRWGVRAFADLAAAAPSQESIVEPEPGTAALMTFTSGTTGRPKAANRTHDILIAQHRALHEEFPEADDEVDMPCFPVVVLHNLCCGITTVMPGVDLREPASVQPNVVLEQIERHAVTRMTGAPAYLTRLVERVEETPGALGGVRSLGAGGAPIPRELCARLVAALPNAEPLVIYGSTEAEPMASVTMRELLDSPGEGYLVGRPSEAATLAVVQFPAEPPVLDDREMEPYCVPPGAVGEVVVKGEHVLKGYVDDPAADQETKLAAPDGAVWHRTGDLGRWDERGRLWLMGRTSDVVRHRGEALYPFAVETAIEAVDGVLRAAVIAHPARPEGEVVLQCRSDADGVVEEVRRRLEERGLGTLPVDVVETMPVDPRHNSKIDRPTLIASRARS